jgi:putative transposase
MVRKSNAAWRSFFRLLEKQREGKLPKHMQGRIHPPGYWKDRQTGKYTKLIVIGRNDRYSLTPNPQRAGKQRDQKRGRGAILKIKTIGRKELTLKLKGKPRWKGRQGAVEVVYDYAFGKWYVHQAVGDAELIEPPKQRYLSSPVEGRGCAIAASDMGVVNLSATAFSNTNIPARLYKGGYVLSDWVYWTKRIAKYQRTLKEANNRSRSKRLSRLYALRSRRVHHKLNPQIRDEVMYAAALGVKTLRIGDLTGLRANNDMGDNANQKIHNFFQYAYRTKRYRMTVEEYGLHISVKSEKHTSSDCSLCGERHRNGRKHRGLYHCKRYNAIINADVNGSENQLPKVSPRPIKPLERVKAMTASGSSQEERRSSRAVTRPTVPQRWNQHLNQWEPRITPPSGG